MARVTTKSKQVDNLDNVASSDIIAGYQAANKDEVPAGTSYYGFVDTDGNWYIQRISATDLDFVRGSSNFAANWAGRAGLSYAKFDSVF